MSPETNPFTLVLVLVHTCCAVNKSHRMSSAVAPVRLLCACGFLALARTRTGTRTPSNQETVLAACIYGGPNPPHFYHIPTLVQALILALPQIYPGDGASRLLLWLVNVPIEPGLPLAG